MVLLKFLNENILKPLTESSFHSRSNIDITEDEKKIQMTAEMTGRERQDQERWQMMRDAADKYVFDKTQQYLIFPG